MSDSDDKKQDSTDDASKASLSDEEMQSLLRGALKSREPESDLLRGVQARIRERSRGKFYDDGWSTAEHPPIYTYLLTTALMLAVLFVIYAVLVPTAGEPEPVKSEPAPVQVVPRRPR